jgi:hypothetical protein
MAFYRVGDAKCNWYVGGQKGRWFAWKGKPTLGSKADAGPFKTRFSALKWVEDYG